MGGAIDKSGCGNDQQGSGLQPSESTSKEQQKTKKSKANGKITGQTNEIKSKVISLGP